MNIIKRVFSISLLILFSIIQLKSQCLSGTYIVGPSPNADYTHPVSALNDLEAQGICGPVVLELEAGTYGILNTIGSIPGSSATNTISIRSQSGDRDSVTLFKSDENTFWGLRFRATQYVSFEDLSFRIRQESPPRGWAQVIHLRDNASHISFKNCRFINKYTTRVQYASHFIYMREVSDILIEGCSFEHRTVAIFKGPNNQSSKLRILNNSFSSMDAAINISDIDSVFINGNTFSPDWSYNLSCARANYIEIRRNNFRDDVLLNTVLKGNSQADNLIANNFLQSSSLFLANCQDFKIVYNTFNNYPLSFNNSQDVEVLNNLFLGRNARPYVSTVADIRNKNFLFDYNGYDGVPGFNFSIGGLGTFSDFTNYQQQTSYGTHSFVGTFYLGPLIDGPRMDSTVAANAAVLNRGLPLSYIDRDIDGQIRSLTQPDMGADEVDLRLPSYDLGVSGLSLPDTVCPGAHDFQVSIENFSPLPIDSFKVYMAQDGIVLDSGVFIASRFLVDSISLAANTITDSVHRFKAFIKPNASSQIKIWVKDANGYLDTLVNNDTLSFQLNSWPLPPEPQLPDFISLAQNGRDTISVAAMPGSASYIWSDGETGANRRIYRPGIYGLTVRNSFGCELQRSLYAERRYVTQDIWITDNRGTRADNNEFSLEGEGNRILVGGEFDLVGPNQPSLARYDLVSQKLLKFPTLRNETSSYLYESDVEVHAIEGDGNGGWYIGGKFLIAGNKARKNLLHVDANGEILPLEIQIDGPIKDLMLRGDSLYIVGAFTEIDGQKRVGAAVIDVQTGLLLNWDAYLYRADLVKMEVYGNVLLLGGQSHQRIYRYSYRYPVLAVDLRSGHLLPREEWQWLYDVWGTSNYTLVAEDISLDGDYLAVREDEGRVFHLPSQQEILNEARGFSFMDIHDGYLYASTVSTLEKIDLSNLSNRQQLFIGGVFNEIVYTDTSFWVVGNMRINQGTASNTPVSVAEFLDSNNAFTGNKILSLGIVNGVSNSPTGLVMAANIKGGQMVLGGKFDGIGALERKNLYEFDLFTQSPTDWQPNPNGKVIEIKKHEGRIYVGGDFTEIGGQAISGMAVFDSARQILPDFSYPINGSVYDFAFNDTNVYIAGDFANVGNYNNKNLFSVNKATGLIQDFEPDPAAYVERLVMLDTVLFLEGRFSSLMDTSIVGRKSCPEGLAYIDPNTAHPYWCHREFRRDESNFGQISSYQGEIYVLSRRVFPYEGKNYLLKFNPITWDMDTLSYLDLNGDIWQYKFACDRLYLFGDFSEVNGEEEHQFAVIDLTSFQVFDQFNNPDSAEAFAIDWGLHPLNSPMLIHQGKWYHSFFLQNNENFMNRASFFSLNMDDIPSVAGSSLSLNFSYQTNGAQVQFQNQSPGTAINYFWDFGDGNVSYQYSPLHTYGQTGTYTVKLIAANECNTDTLSSQVQINSTVGIDFLPEESLKLFPNPSQGKITLEFNQVLDRDTRIRVLDTRGKNLFMEKLGPQASNSSMELDFPELPNGIYFLMLEQAGSRITKKFMIQD